MPDRRLRRPGARWRLLVHEPGGTSHHVTSSPTFGGRVPDSDTHRTHVLLLAEFDELAVGRFLHIEQMGIHTWWMNIGGVTVHVDADRDGRPTHVWVAGPGDYAEPVDGCTYLLTWGEHQDGKALT